LLFAVRHLSGRNDREDIYLLFIQDHGSDREKVLGATSFKIEFPFFSPLFPSFRSKYSRSTGEDRVGFVLVKISL
jgi:hypothetical protein